MVCVDHKLTVSRGDCCTYPKQVFKTVTTGLCTNSPQVVGFPERQLKLKEKNKKRKKKSNYNKESSEITANSSATNLLKLKLCLFN